MSTPATAPLVRQPVTFAGLLRHNRNVRLLWSGQLVSQLGDWFNSVAVYTLLLELTGSATAVAVMMVVQLLPTALVGPWAGVIVDRMNRQRVLVVADVVRGVLILGLLLVRSAADVWLAYAVVGLTVAATGFFEPARSATIPNITSPDELVPANALSSATWSAMLAVGAALGGLVTAVLGRDVAFLLNSASFFASAAFIFRMRLPRTTPRTSHAALKGTGAGFLEGVRFIGSHPTITALASVKGVWAIAGGILLLLTVFGERVFPVGGSAAAGIGILYAARGVGAVLGSLAAKWVCGSDADRLRRAIAPGYLIAGAFYICFGLAPSLALASLAVVGAHVGGSLLWVASTVLLQLSVPDRLRGRVFAIEFALLTLVSSAMSYTTGWALDTLHYDARTLAVTLGTLFFIPGVFWAWLAPRLRERAQGPAAALN